MIERLLCARLTAEPVRGVGVREASEGKGGLRLPSVGLSGSCQSLHHPARGSTPLPLRKRARGPGAMPLGV